jgi:GntR family transcriptional regulator
MIEDKLGLPVMRGEEEISVAAVGPALARRLHVLPGSPVLVLEITYFGVDGRPLEYTRLWYRADRFRRRNQLARRAAGIGAQAPAPLPRTAGT